MQLVHAIERTDAAERFIRPTVEELRQELVGIVDVALRAVAIYAPSTAGISGSFVSSASVNWNVLPSDLRNT